MNHYPQKKPKTFNPSMLRVKRKEEINKEIKEVEKNNPTMSKALKETIENLSEEKLKENARKTVKRYIEEANGEGEFDFLKDEIDEEDRVSLNSDRAKFQKRKKLRLLKQGA